MAFRLLPILRVISTPPVRRTIHMAQPMLATSKWKGDMDNAGKQWKDNGVDDIPGAKVPEYSGPSISEKQSPGKSEKIDKERAEEMSSNRKKEFADNLFEEPSDLKDDGSDWDGQIHQSGTSARSNQSLDHDTSGKPMKKGTKLTNGIDQDLDFGHMKRSMSTFPDRDGDRLKEDIKDDMTRAKQKAGNDLRKAKLAAADKATDLKEGAQELWHKTKKAARNLKESVQDTVNEAMEPLKEDNPTGNVVQNPLSQGPQQMPQGVNKRAKDAKGNPMETGVRGS